MNIFLTGATGVIGRRVVPLLVAAGHRVGAMVHAPEKAGALTKAGARPLKADLFSLESLRRAIAGHETVINLATHMPIGLKMFLPGAWAENDRIRREGSANLVHAAIAEGVVRFIQELFAPVYPDRGEAWIDEKTPIAPVRYNRSVADAEASTQRFATGGAIGTILRFGAFYGPDAWQTRDLIGYVRRGFAPMPGKPSAYVSSISHDDAAAAVVAATGGAVRRLQCGGRRAGAPSRVFRRAGGAAGRCTAVAATALAHFPVRLGGRDARALAAHVEPQAARRMRLGATVPQRARRLRRCSRSDRPRGAGHLGRGLFAEPPIDDRTRGASEQRRDPEQPELLIAQPPTNSAGPVLRAGLTDVLVTGIDTRWMSVSASPMASGAKPTGALPCVAPMMTNRKLPSSRTP